MMKPDHKVLVKDIVSVNFRTADIFARYGIDFCCGGGITIAQASQKADVDVEQLITDLEGAMQMPDRETELLNRLSLDELAHYIVETHHTFVRSNIITISDYMARIVMAHGDKHPELETIQHLFQASSIDLTSHMQKEEVLLFPYISSLVKASRIGARPAPAAFSSISDPIAAMEEDHLLEGNRFMEISRLSNNYVMPQGGCNTYKVAFEKLKAFEQDLHRHIHLENNILFPKAKQLESEVLS